MFCKLQRSLASQPTPDTSTSYNTDLILSLPDSKTLLIRQSSLSRHPGPFLCYLVSIYLFIMTFYLAFSKAASLSKFICCLFSRSARCISCICSTHLEVCPSRPNSFQKSFIWMCSHWPLCTHGTPCLTHTDLWRLSYGEIALLLMFSGVCVSSHPVMRSYPYILCLLLLRMLLYCPCKAWCTRWSFAHYVFTGQISQGNARSWQTSVIDLFTPRQKIGLYIWSIFRYVFNSEQSHR